MNRGTLLASCLAASAFAVSTAAATIRPATSAEIEVIRVAMQEKLKDADSAKFKDVMYAVGDKGGIDTVCGKVNAKNSFGAYNGYLPFYAAYVRKEGEMKRAMAMLVTIGDDGVAAKMCADAGL